MRMELLFVCHCSIAISKDFIMALKKVCHCSIAIPVRGNHEEASVMSLCWMACAREFSECDVFQNYQSVKTDGVRVEDVLKNYT
uniref:Uncharacterized protein n=1 Tax=Tanacetum cinerariifolium TaxID=118510 RepID=A0A699Q6M1_TANCI|nr:hypothetical protein [Tanacetum cinerariifolium]